MDLDLKKIEVGNRVLNRLENDNKTLLKESNTKLELATYIPVTL